MKDNNKNFCSGALVGTLGFFGSCLTINDPVYKAAMGGGIAGLAATAISSLPTIQEHENFKPAAVFAGAVAFAAAGFVLQYAAGVPDVGVLIILFISNFLVNSQIDKLVNPNLPENEFRI
jgi:hypothetical protein